MYVIINNQAVAIDIASEILGISPEELHNAGHTIEQTTDKSFINYSI